MMTGFLHPTPQLGVKIRLQVLPSSDRSDERLR